MNRARLAPDIKTLSLSAPIDGVLFPLQSVPDPVFADKVLGDGLAIDPTSARLVAPCSGVITQLHRAKHALTIRSMHGVSILLHVGVDTVALGGEGFSLEVSEGDEVEVGQLLSTFDLDLVARSAKSALVEVIVTEGAELVPFELSAGQVVSAGDQIVHVSLSGPPHSGTHETGATLAEVRGTFVRVVNPHGIHARPAARLTQQARLYDARVFLTAGGKTASASSVTEIMSLDLGLGDEVEVWATGNEAVGAVEMVRRVIAEGLGENLERAEHLPEATRLVSDEAGVLGGVPASPGLAVGVARIHAFGYPPFPETAADPELERAALRRGLERAARELNAEKARLAAEGQAEKAQIFAAHGELLADEDIVLDAEKAIGLGKSAAWAFHDAMQARTSKLGTLKSPLLRQRATDLSDVAHRTLHAILGLPRPSLELEPDTVLVCADLSPSTVVSLDAKRIAAIVTELGGATSHAAIIARTMGVPYVAAVGEGIRRIVGGQTLIVNGRTGAVTLDPTAEALELSRVEIGRMREAGAREQNLAHEPALTADGFRIEVAANIGGLGDVELADQSGCDAVGLLRSEFLFLGRRDAPSEAEQRDQYVAIAKVLGKRRSLVVRTLDVGGDKPLSYMPLGEEENPFLGIRGIRVSLKYPELFRSQLRAALAAASFTELRLMFPMVSGRDELLRARDIALEEKLALGVSEPVSIGVMVEVPSAALNARWLAKDVDFFSIGTNDLTQYTLAMDRGHAELATRVDAFEPAVLRLIEMTAQAAHAEGKWVGVCGELASDSLATPVLVGLGIDELSVPAMSIPGLKQRVRSLNRARCESLAKDALAQPSAKTVRELLSSFSSD